MKLFTTILIYLITHSVFGQYDSFKFLKKNHKLNRRYEIEMKQKEVPLFYSSQSGINNFSRTGEKLNVYPLNIDGDPRFVNPDMIEVRYDYRRFDMGNMIPNILKTVNLNPQ